MGIFTVGHGGKVAAAATVAALLSGCASLAPPFERPAPPLRDAWTAAPLAAAGAAPDQTPPADIGWSGFFTDDRLRQTVAAALQGNADLQVAASNIEQARALYRIERGAGLPQLGLGAAATRQGGNAATGGSSYRVDLGLASWEIDFFGRVQSLSASALAAFFAEQDNRDSVQISLVAEVATAWLTLAADQQRLWLARQTLASQQTSLDLTRRARALGAASGLNLARAQTTVDAARVDVARFTTLLAQDRNALELLVGRPLEAGWLPQEPVPVAAAMGLGPASADADAAASASAGIPPAGGRASLLATRVPIVAPLPAASLLVAVPAGVPSDVLLRRPDVRAAEQRLRAANANIGAARAALYPRISLTAAAGKQSDSLSRLLGNGSGFWSLVPRIDLPLFDGGQRRADVQLTQAQRTTEIARYQGTVQNAFREVADALALRATLAEQLAAQESLAEASQRSLQLSDALYRNGASSYLEVLDAQRTLYAAQQDLIGLRLSEQTNRVTLYRVLGGGFGER